MCLQIDADVKESKSLLSYMQRCCLCFLCACCCDCDPSVKEDRTRKNRVKQWVLGSPSLVFAKRPLHIVQYKSSSPSCCRRNKDRKEFKGMVDNSRTETNGIPLDQKQPVLPSVPIISVQFLSARYCTLPSAGNQDSLAVISSTARR